MPDAVLIDTSVLLEILRVPGKSQRHDEITEELRARVDDLGETLLLPTATIIETGNHIAQLGEGLGDARRKCAVALDRFLRAAASSAHPWTLLGAPWDTDMLRRICDGGGPRGAPALPGLAQQGVGAGDASIIAEAEDYARRVARVNVTIWTLDRGLLAYSGPSR